jgi:hypothetical protein
VYDGNTWSLSFDSQEWGIYSLAVYNGKLYAGSRPEGKVYVYDGTSWELAFDSQDWGIYSLAVYNGKLYAGTYDKGKIYVYDGNSWSYLTDMFEIMDEPGIESPPYLGDIKTLVEYNGKLYAGTGGLFYWSIYGGDIFVYDGTSWNLALDTDEHSIRSLAVYNDKLYAGASPAGKIFVFDGTSWEISFDNMEDEGIYSLTVYNDNLYTGIGTFGQVFGFDGSQWVVAFDSPEHSVNTLAGYAGNLYAGTSTEGRIYGPCETTVDIDIKPTSDPNSINCKNMKGVIPVAILTTDEFDATTVDHTTVSFGKNGTEASETHVNKKTGVPKRHEEDVDGDGDMDLVFHFRFGDTGIECADDEAILTGETFGGQKIKGSDTIRMIGY